MRRIQRPACGSIGAAQGETGSCFLRDPLARTYHTGRPLVEEEVGVGRKMILLLGWLTRGVRLAAAAGEAEGRAGVSGALGRLAGPSAAARRLGWLAGRAGQAGCEALLLFFFCFVFLLLYLNSNLIWSLNSNLVYLIHWIIICEAHNTLIYLMDFI